MKVGDIVSIKHGAKLFFTKFPTDGHCRSIDINRLKIMEFSTDGKDAYLQDVHSRSAQDYPSDFTLFMNKADLVGYGEKVKC